MGEEYVYFRDAQERDVGAINPWPFCCNERGSAPNNNCYKPGTRSDRQQDNNCAGMPLKAPIPNGQTTTDLNSNYRSVMGQAPYLPEYAVFYPPCTEDICPLRGCPP